MPLNESDDVYKKTRSILQNNLDREGAAADGELECSADPTGPILNSIERSDGDTTTRTRSSNGIVKKRILPDAATNEEIGIPPPVNKKIRFTPSRVLLGSAGIDNSNKVDSDIYAIQPQSIAIDNSASISPPTVHDALHTVNQQSPSSDTVSTLDGNDICSPLRTSSAVSQHTPCATVTNEDSSVHRGGVVAGDISGIHAVETVAIDSDSVSPNIRVRKTFKDVFSDGVAGTQNNRIMVSGPVLHDDYMRFHVDSLPAKCQVTNPALHDPILAKDYGALPPLKPGSLRSWSTTATGSSKMERLVLFSEWLKQCPNLDFEAACDAIRFNRYKHFINPSRISPKDVNILYTSHDKKRSVLQCNSKTAICLSPILSADCHLIDPSPSGLKTKYISGYFHQQEWQRFQGFTCMVFDRLSLVAQIYNDTISFMTSGPLKADRDSYLSSKTPRNPNILKATPGSSSEKLTSPKSFRPSLNYTDAVPIYDARDVLFNFTTDLEQLDMLLPKYDYEIPPGSFVIVGYTMSHYEKDSRSNLSTNVQFAILLATE